MSEAYNHKGGKSAEDSGHVSREGHDRVESKKDLDALVAEAAAMIESGSNMYFGVAATGNVVNSEKLSGTGVNCFYYGPQTKTMVRNDDLGFLDANQRKGSTDTLFEGQWDLVERPNGLRCVTYRLPFKPITGRNVFCSDSRSGVHMTLTVFFSKEQIAHIENADIAQQLQEPQIEFFAKLIDACAKKYIPDYYMYVQGVKRAYEASRAH